jgi:hypothetical protein
VGITGIREERRGEGKERNGKKRRGVMSNIKER